MPTTLGGLAIFVIFLTPGFLNFIQRRRRVPQRKLSSLVEVATFVSISVLTNLAALAAFSFFRWLEPDHSPNVDEIVTLGSKYIDPRLGYIILWSGIILAFSCTLAILIGARPGPLARITPLVVDSSAWYQVFESGPPDTRVYLGCDMNDGSYVSGYLDWSNTDIDEVADRDLVLASPITIVIDGQESDSECQRIILSARNIAKLSVDFPKAHSDNTRADVAGSTHPTVDPGAASDS